MKLSRNVTFVTIGLLLAGIMLGGSIAGTLAAESTTKDSAIQIALDDAGYSEGDVTFDDVEKGKGQGAAVYEIEFWTDTEEFEYDIAIADGEIVSVSRKQTDFSPSGPQVTKSEAKGAALAHAGLSKDEVTFTKDSTGTEDGIPVYEFNFEDSATKYKYEITKEGGEVLSYSKTIKTPACVSAAKK